MKILSKLIITLIFINFFSNSNAQNKANVAAKLNAKTKVVSNLLKSTNDSLSYAIGINIAENLANQKITLNENILAQAIKDFTTKKQTLIPVNQCGQVIQGFFQKEAGKAGAVNKKKGDDFLTKNKTQPGIITTASGLQYLVAKASDGAKPTTADKVKVHYHGTLIDGTVFDSSVQRNEPATFGVTQVIPGWVEGLQLMNVGSKYKFFIPSNLAYGKQGPPNIGPDQVLIFDVELLEIVK